MSDNCVMVPLLGSVRLSSSGPIGVSYVPEAVGNQCKTPLSAMQPITDYPGVLSHRYSNANTAEIICSVSGKSLGIVVYEIMSNNGRHERKNYREFCSIAEF